MREPIDREIITKEIDTIRSVLEKNIHPLEAYLFGSASGGTFTDQSDYDLLIVMPGDSECRTAQKDFAKIRSLLPNRPFDVIWFSKVVFEKKKNWGGVALVAFKEGTRLI